MENFEGYLRERLGLKAVTAREKARQVEMFKALENNGQRLEEACRPELRKMAEIQKIRCSARTANNRLKALEQYFGYLEYRGLRADNPATGLRVRTEDRAKIPVLLTDEEMGDIYSNYCHTMKCDAYGLRGRAVLGLMAGQGLDAGSLRVLDAEGIGWDSGTIAVPASSESRLLYRLLPLEVWQIKGLSEYLENGRPEILAKLKSPDSGKLFPSGSKTKFSPMLRTLKRRTGLEDLKILRQSRISLWIGLYGIRKAQYMSGCRSLAGLEKLDAGRMEKLRRTLESGLP
jgi:site-specific recombinase XerD